jgi:hypothetical protein
MKQIRSCIAALGLVFVLALAACDTPTSNGGGNDDEGSTGPEDGTLWIFENQSSYDIRISPDNGKAPDQGWDVFSLLEGESKNIRVNLMYDSIYFGYNYFEEVHYEVVPGKHQIVFRDKPDT